MPKYKKTTNAEKIASIQTELTDMFIKCLEQNIIPWEKPWKFKNLNGFTNIVTGNTYQNYNDLFCMMRSALNGYNSPYFITYKQAKDLGANVRKGEKSLKLSYWNFCTPKDELSKPKAEQKQYGFLKNFNVFNLEQIENLHLDKYISLLEKQNEKNTLIGENNEKNESCEEVINAYLTAQNINVKPASYAAYAPTMDFIMMPDLKMFNSESSYYATFFHEIAHSTGHQTRLDRVLEGFNKRSHNYSLEELNAEISAGILCRFMGIDTPKVEKNRVAYIQGWASKLKSNPKWIYEASKNAKKIVHLVLNPLGEVA